MALTRERTESIFHVNIIVNQPRYSKYENNDYGGLF